MVAINYLGMFVFGFVAGMIIAKIILRKERNRLFFDNRIALCAERNALNVERLKMAERTRKEYDEIIQETLYDLGVNREVSEKAMGAIEHAKKRIRGKRTSQYTKSF